MNIFEKLFCYKNVLRYLLEFLEVRELICLGGTCKLLHNHPYIKYYMDKLNWVDFRSDLPELALELKDEKLARFCRDIFDTNNMIGKLCELVYLYNEPDEKEFLIRHFLDSDDTIDNYPIRESLHDYIDEIPIKERRRKRFKVNSSEYEYEKNKYS